MPRRGRIPVSEKIAAVEARIVSARNKVLALEKKRDAMFAAAMDKARADVQALEAHREATR